MDELPIRREFGRRVRRRRLALDLFQKDLARQIGMPPAQLSRLEKGGYRSINIAKLVQLADALHTSTDYLLARSEDPGPVPNRIAPVAASACEARHHYRLATLRNGKSALSIIGKGVIVEQSWTDFLAKQRQTHSGPIGDNIHFIRAKDTTGRMACYFVRIYQTRLPLFREALKSPDIISLNDYGEIIASNYGEQPTEQTKRILREKYGLEI